VRGDARRAARRALRVVGASWLAAAPAACTSFQATAPNGVRPGASLRLRAARGEPAATVHAGGPEGGPAPDARCLVRGAEGRVAESRGPAADTLRLVRFAVVPLASHRVGCGSLGDAAESVWVVRLPDARLATARFSGRRTAILLGSVAAVVGVVAFSVSQMQFDLGSGGRGSECMSIC
jgi:hypothetical protein